MIERTTTLGDMFREMHSFIPCSEYFKRADASGINIRNRKALKDEVRKWSNGLYDEDPYAMLNSLISILEKA
jgi:hypothetical protein